MIAFYTDSKACTRRLFNYEKRQSGEKACAFFNKRATIFCLRKKKNNHFLPQHFKQKGFALNKHFTDFSPVHFSPVSLSQETQPHVVETVENTRLFNVYMNVPTQVKKTFRTHTEIHQN